MQEKIITYLKQNELATMGTLARLLGITYYRTNNIVLNMIIEGKLTRKKLEGNKTYLYTLKQEDLKPY